MRINLTMSCSDIYSDRIRDIDMLSFMDKVQKDEEVKEDTVVEGK